MTTLADAIRDRNGVPMFRCPDCAEPLSPTDIFEHGLRLPFNGESRDEYFDAELLDELGHVACARARSTRRGA